MERNVFLRMGRRCGSQKSSDGFIELSQEIFRYADENCCDPYDLVQWLVRSWYLCPVSRYDRTARCLYLTDVTFAERNTVRRAVRELDLALTVLGLIMYHGGQNVALSHTIRRLDLRIADRISPDMLPSMIRALPLLQAIIVEMIYGTADQGGLGSAACCTQQPFEIPMGIDAYGLSKIEKIEISGTTVHYGNSSCRPCVGQQPSPILHWRTR